LSFYQKYRMSTSDDEVNLRKGDEVVVIDGSLHGIEGHVMGITPWDVAFATNAGFLYHVASDKVVKVAKVAPPPLAEQPRIDQEPDSFQPMADQEQEAELEIDSDQETEAEIETDSFLSSSYAPTADHHEAELASISSLSVPPAIEIPQISVPPTASKPAPVPKPPPLAQQQETEQETVLNQSTCSSVPACVAATRTSEQATIPHLPTSNEQVPDWFDSVEEFDI
jgi:hypothetical protein